MAIVVSGVFSMSAVLFTFWYVLQRRELKRFFQQEEVNQIAQQAIAKEVEVTNVLNLQNDAVIICSKKANTESVVGSESDASDQI